MAAEVLELSGSGQSRGRSDFLSLVPNLQPEPGGDYDIAWDIPPEILIGDPLPEAVFNAYLGVIDPLDYGFKRWERDHYIQISSSTLRKPPRNALDDTSLYSIESVMASGDTTLYEAEVVLAYLDGWNSNRREYIPTGAVRITGFSSARDESMEHSEVMDSASVQLSYEDNKLVHGHMLRLYQGGSRPAGGEEILPTGDVVSFAIPTESKSQVVVARQLRFDGYQMEKGEEEREPEVLVLPSVRVEKGDAIMTHFGKPYELEGETMLQKIEIRAPFDITGLVELIREQGRGEGEVDTEDETREVHEAPQQFPSLTEVYKAATHFPVVIKTAVVSVR